MFLSLIIDDFRLDKAAISGTGSVLGGMVNMHLK